MIKRFIPLAVAMLLANLTFATVEKSDTLKVDETWSEDTVKVTGDITINDGVTLTINPGVYVEFQGHYGINVQGRILAEGTTNDSIIFTVNDTTNLHLNDTLGCWSGIRFINNSVTNDTSRISNCVFEYSRLKTDGNYKGGGALSIIGFNKVNIKNSTFKNNSAITTASSVYGGAIYIRSSQINIDSTVFKNNFSYSNSYYHNGGALALQYSTNSSIKNNEFLNNEARDGGAIDISGGSNIIIESNLFLGNNSIGGGGINLSGSTDIIISNNVFTLNFAWYNYGAGVGTSYSDAEIINNVFYNNVGSGMEMSINSNIEIYNTIFNENSGSSLVMRDYNDIDVKVFNSCLESDLDDIINSKYISEFKNNLNVNPNFIDPDNGNFKLNDSSYLIDAGFIGSDTLEIDTLDYYGESRIMNNRIDIGVSEFQSTPANRLPILSENSLVGIKRSETTIVPVYFEELDNGDIIHTITVNNLDNNVVITNISGGSSGSTFEITPKDKFVGFSRIAISVTDDSGIINQINTDTLNIGIGDLWGVVETDSIISNDTVYVVSDVVIKSLSKLTISPSTKMMFLGNFKMDILGSLVAKGTANDSIKFSVPDSLKTVGWNGIVYSNVVTSNDSSIFNYCEFSYSKSDNYYGGGVFSVRDYSKIQLSNCLFHHNSATRFGGAVFIFNGYFDINSCVFRDNYADESGGAVFIVANDDEYITINNCLFYNNGSKLNGGALGIAYNWSASNSFVNIYNTTITDNFSNQDVGGIHIKNGILNITNSIISNNTGYQLVNDVGTVNISFTRIDTDDIDNKSILNANNIIPDQGSLFSNSESHIYSLHGGSNCINSGKPDWTLDSTYSVVDILGDNRIAFDRIDLGAYEYGQSLSFLNKTISIYENLSNGSVVDTVSAYYFGSNSLVYNILSGNDNSVFNLNSLIGEVIVNDSSALNYEFAKSFDIEIEVTDGEDSDTAILKIDLIDVDEFGINPFLGFNRTGAVSFVIDSTVYVGLGNNADSVMCNFWKYDLESDLWTEICRFPGNPRSEAVAIVINGKAYVGLGRSEYPYQYYKDFYEYNPEIDKWTQVDDFAGTARYSAVAFVIDSDGFVGTGIDATDEQKNFWKYNPDLNTWTQVADLNGDKRSGAVAFVINGKAYVSGGQYFDSYSVQLSDVREYDPETNTWEERIFADGINLSFTDAASIVMGDKGYICYGNKSAIVSYNPSNNEVNNYGDVFTLSDKRYDPIAFILDSTAFFGLGYYGVFDPVYTNDILELDQFPTDINLSNNSLDENNSLGLLIGTFSTVDGDASDTHTYSLVAGDGVIDADNSSFSISGNELHIDVVCDFEIKDEYKIYLQTEDYLGATFKVAFVISVNDLNENPTNIELSANVIDENKAVGTAIGTFSTVDEDTGDTHTYSLVTGNGSNDADNGIFTISGNELQSTEVFNYEVKNEYYIYLSTEDSEGESYEKAFVISVNNLSENPTNVELSANVIDENKAVGTVIGIFRTVDEDTGDTHTYSLVTGNGSNDADNGSFTIFGNELQSNEVFNYEVKDEYYIYIESDDGSGGTFKKDFVITIMDINEFGINPFRGDNRTGAVNFVIDSSVYVGLGNNADSVMYNFWKYDLATNLWTEITNYPGSPRSEAVSFIIDGKAYVGLGRSEYPYQYYKDFYEYNPETNVWTQIADFAGTARYNAVSFAINSFGFVGTGQDGTDEQKDFWKYDTGLDSWTQVADLSGDKRSGAAVFVINGKAYVSGGQYYDSYSVQLSDVQEYDPLTDLWVEKIFADGTNLSFSDAASFVMGDKGYICYGNKQFVVSYNQETNKVTNYGDALGLGDNRFDPISFVLGSTSYFGLGYYDVFSPVYKNDILEIDHMPLDILLSNYNLDENSSIGSVIGSFNSLDNDIGDTHTYFLITGDGINDADNNNFSILGNDLRNEIDLDFETKSEYYLYIQTEDELGAIHRKPFVININNINETPADITVSSDIIYENSSIGTVIGMFNAIDEDTGDTHTYSLGEGNGVNDIDNNSFTISGNELQSTAIFNFESKNQYYIYVNTEDQKGESFNKAFVIDIIDVNENPTEIELSSNTIDENSAIGNAVGECSTIDEDSNDSHIYTLVIGNGINDADNSSFTILGDKLQNAEIFDFEVKSEYYIFIETDDGNGGVFRKEFIITVNDLTETGIQDLSAVNIKVFPNPTSDFINIDFAKSIFDQLNVKIVNSNGQVVYEEQVNKKIFNIDLTGNAKGIYYIVLKNSNFNGVQKIILK